MVNFLEREKSFKEAIVISFVVHIFLVVLFVVLSLNSQIIMIPRSRAIVLTGVANRSEALLERNFTSKPKRAKNTIPQPEYVIKDSPITYDLGKVKLKKIVNKPNIDSLIDMDRIEEVIPFKSNDLTDIDDNIEENDIEIDIPTEDNIESELAELSQEPSSVEREGYDTQIQWDDPNVVRKIEKFVQPEYPEDLVKKGYEGVVVLTIWVTQEGYIQNAEVKKSSGYTELDELAKSTIYKWKIAPSYDKEGIEKAETKFIFKIKK